MVKNKGGRPSKLDNIDLDKLEYLSSLGLIDTEIAKILDISEASLNNYKKDTKFLESLKRGKDICDNKVVKRLFERAIGYEHEEDKVFCHNGEIVTHRVMKYYPPDPTSLIFWLKNRQKGDWRDKQDIEHSGTVNVSTVDYSKAETE